MNKSKLKKYITNFSNFMKVFLMLFMMTVGFLFTYLLICFWMSIPIYDWMFIILVGLAFLSEYGYFKWIES